MTEQWKELKEIITELRDNDGTGTQQEVCKFIVNYMEVLEKQMQEPVLGKIRTEIEEYKSRQLTLAIGVADLEKGKQIAIEYILAILNKYDTESEG